MGPIAGWLHYPRRRRLAPATHFAIHWVVIPVADFARTKQMIGDMAINDALLFLRDHSPRLPTYVSAIVLKDLRQAMKYTSDSVQKLLHRPAIESIPSLQIEAIRDLDTHRRTGSLVGVKSDYTGAKFGCPVDRGGYLRTEEN